MGDIAVIWEILLMEDVLWEIFVIRECVVCRKVVRLVINIGCEAFL